MKSEVPNQWKIHLPNLLKEILNSNDKMAIFAQPFNILGVTLSELGERCIELNDPVLNAFMLRLTIYSVSDPESVDFDKSVCEKVLSNPEYIKWLSSRRKSLLSENI